MDVSEDQLRLIFTLVANPLCPRDAVSFSSTCQEVEVATREERRELKERSQAAMQVCKRYMANPMTVLAEGRLGAKVKKEHAGEVAEYVLPWIHYIGFLAIGDDGLEKVGRAMCGNRSLITLYLDSNKLGNAGAAAVGRALPSMRLERLYIDRNHIGDPGAMAIADGLKASATLRFLNLGSNRIGDEAAASIGDAISTSSMVRTLYLYANRLGDVGCSRIGEALGSSASLRTVDLSHNEIGREGARVVAKGVERNESLCVVYISSAWMQHDEKEEMSRRTRRRMVWW